ncbi:MAG: DUF3109 family protein [Aureispira sp.]|nr:DUF3109 family protein [Aureispira sp.]
MIIIDNKVVNIELVEEQFVCNLDACKGCCCWEGDFGAPLDQDELDILKEIYPKVKPYLTQKGIDAIEMQGTSVYTPQEKEFSTPLVDNSACAYLNYDEKGIAKCGIEKAYEDGVIDYKKPISCHLYPIRTKQMPNPSFEALNYDRWDICSDACTFGKELKVPVYKFLKDALIRKYGEGFYEQLDATAQYYTKK